MNLITQIKNWLTIGLEQPIGSMNEDFYYDKKNNEFFSIVITDKFMVDENMNIAEDVTTSYSKEQEKSITDRMKRIESEDSEILSIERIFLNERKQVMQEFVDTLSDKVLIGILNQRIINQSYSTKFDFYFGNEADELTKQNWEEYKSSYLLQKADTFLNLNNINIETATIWDVDATGNISIDLTKEKTETDISNISRNKTKTVWWKFW